MKLGVLSDTHFSSLADGLSFMEALCAGPFADVDLILHAGDIVHPDLIYCFDERPLIAVRGNCDEPIPELPERRVLELDGFRIGIMHGWGAPAGIVDQVLDSFSDENLDVLIFGHSHYPLCRRHGDLLLFNPGSATDRREAPCHTVGILQLNGAVEGMIVNLDSQTAGIAEFKGVSL